MLTPTQLATVKADILANPDLAILPNGSDGSYGIAALYNLPATPTYTVWRSDVSTRDCKKAMVWTEFIIRSAGERDAWQFMLVNGTLNMNDLNVRQGIQDIFSGASGANTRAALLLIAKRPATRLEKLLAGGSGSEASPSTLGFEGAVSYQDIDQARG